MHADAQRTDSDNLILMFSHLTNWNTGSYSPVFKCAYLPVDKTVTRFLPPPHTFVNGAFHRSIVVGIFQVMRLHHVRVLSQKSETDPSVVVVVSIVSAVRDSLRGKARKQHMYAAKLQNTGGTTF